MLTFVTQAESPAEGLSDKKTFPHQIDGDSFFSSIDNYHLHGVLVF